MKADFGKMAVVFGRINSAMEYVVVVLGQLKVVFGSVLFVAN